MINFTVEDGRGHQVRALLTAYGIKFEETPDISVYQIVKMDYASREVSLSQVLRLGDQAPSQEQYNPQETEPSPQPSYESDHD